MQKKSFRQAFLDGLASIGQGWCDISTVWPNPHMRPWRYEDHFGTDEEQIRRDWEAVGIDMQAAIDDEITSTNETEEE